MVLKFKKNMEGEMERVSENGLMVCFVSGLGVQKKTYLLLVFIKILIKKF